jgi:hypothetical protein
VKILILYSVRRKTKIEMVGTSRRGFKKMKVRSWRKKCGDRRLWNEIIKQAKTHQGL